ESLQLGRNRAALVVRFCRTDFQSVRKAVWKTALRDKIMKAWRRSIVVVGFLVWALPCLDGGPRSTPTLALPHRRGGEQNFVGGSLESAAYFVPGSWCLASFARGSCLADEPGQKAEPKHPGYEFKENHDPNGIGKFY